MVIRRYRAKDCVYKMNYDQNVMLSQLSTIHPLTFLGKVQNIFAEPNITGLHGAYTLLELGWRAHGKLVNDYQKKK